MLRDATRLAYAAGPHQVRVVAAAQTATLAGVVAFALLARSLVRDLLPAHAETVEASQLLPTVALLAAITAALAVTQAVGARASRVLAELTQRHGEDLVLAITARVPLIAFDDPEFHDRVARAVQGVRLLPSAVNSLAGLLRAAAVALGAFGVLVAVAPPVAPTLLLAAVPLTLTARLRSRTYHRFIRSITPRDRERRYLAELLTDRRAAEEIRAFELADVLDRRRAGLWEERLTALDDVTRTQLRATALTGVSVAVVLGTALALLVALAAGRHVSLSSAGVAIGAVLVLGRVLSAAGSSAAGLAESAAFIADLLAFAENEPRSAPASARDRGRQRGEAVPAPRVTADQVTFAYPSGRVPALQDVSLVIEPGEVVALAGANGSGKTTLAKLLAGLHQPASGRVTWDGTDVATLDPAARRDGVAVLFQDFQRYSLPARDNVGLGRHEQLEDMDAIEAAARAAGVHDELAALPNGYRTLLGPAFVGGTDLSSGQWQRVALARAFAADAPFVVLDEPTAALDPRAEHELFLAARELLAGRSLLLISHRLSSVRTADRIVVLDRGRIIEHGTHADLIARGGEYAEIFALQAAPYR